MVVSYLIFSIIYFLIGKYFSKDKNIKIIYYMTSILWLANALLLWNGKNGIINW